MEFVAIGLPSASKTKSLLNCGPYHELRNASTARHKLVAHAIVRTYLNYHVWVSIVKFEFQLLSLILKY